jgi:hypothetical protein
MDTEIKTEEFGIRDILSAGWAVFRSKFVIILMITLSVYIPYNILTAFLQPLKKPPFLMIPYCVP